MTTAINGQARDEEIFLLKQQQPELTLSELGKRFSLSPSKISTILAEQESHNRIKQLTEQNERLQKRSEDLQNKLHELQKTTNNVQELQKENTRLTEKLNVLTESNRKDEDIYRKFLKAENDLQKATEQITFLTERLQNLQNERDDLQKKLKNSHSFSLRLQKEYESFSVKAEAFGNYVVQFFTGRSTLVVLIVLGACFMAYSITSRIYTNAGVESIPAFGLAYVGEFSAFLFLVLSKGKWWGVGVWFALLSGMQVVLVTNGLDVFGEQFVRTAESWVLGLTRTSTELAFGWLLGWQLLKNKKEE